MCETRTGPCVGDLREYRGTGSAKAANRIRERMGLVNHATKISKKELAPDSPEMLSFVGEVQKALVTFPLCVGHRLIEDLDPARSIFRCVHRDGGFGQTPDID